MAPIYIGDNPNPIEKVAIGDSFIQKLVINSVVIATLYTTTTTTTTTPAP
jgi:hypothetical protein